MFRKRFPAVTVLGRLAGAQKEGENFGRRLDEIVMTPLGSMIARLVLEQMLGIRFGAVLMQRTFKPTPEEGNG